MKLTNYSSLITDITCQKGTNTTHMEIFFWSKQSERKTPEDHWVDFKELEKVQFSGL